MAEATGIQHFGGEEAIPHALADHVARVELGIEEAEQLVAAQERRVREAERTGDAARARFDLQKMQLLLALLREGRARLLARGPGRQAQQPAR